MLVCYDSWGLVFLVPRSLKYVIIEGTKTKNSKKVLTRFYREFRTMTKNSHGYMGNRTRSSRHIVCIQYTLDIRHKVMLVSVYLIPNRGNFLSGWDWKHLFLPFNFVCARLHILPQLRVNCRLNQLCKVKYPPMRIPVSNKPSLTICVWASTSQKSVHSQ